MYLVAIIVLTLASSLVGVLARRGGPAAKRLQWLALALAAAALAVALWTVARMVGDHRRDEPAPVAAAR